MIRNIVTSDCNTIFLSFLNKLQYKRIHLYFHKNSFFKNKINCTVGSHHDKNVGQAQRL